MEVEKKTVLTEDPKYCIATKNFGWDTEMIGTEPVDGSDKYQAGIMGLPITNFTVAAKGIKKARVRNKRGRWLPYHTDYDNIKGFGDGTEITGIEIVGSGYTVSVHYKGGSWARTVNTSDEDGVVLIGTGSPIDALWIKKK